MSYQQLSVAKIVGLHLLPGILALGFYPVAKSVVVGAGYPTAYAHFLTILFILVPVELGYLLYQSGKGSAGFSRVILYRERLPIWQYIVLVAVLFLWALFIFFVATPPVSKFLFQHIFKSFAGWFFFDAGADPRNYSQAFFIVTWLLNFLLAGLVTPVVHELYYRGHLLPRMSHLGLAAPVLNALLFSLARSFYAPWWTPARFLAFLPLAYITWRKKNVWVAVFAHIAIDSIPIFLFFFR